MGQIVINIVKGKQTKLNPYENYLCWKPLRFN